jgi:transmembrane 9 superfamily protein 1
MLPPSKHPGSPLPPPTPTPPPPLPAGIAGYTSASYYRQMEGTKWVSNLLLTCFVFCGPLFLAFSINNTVAWMYGVSDVARSPAAHRCYFFLIATLAFVCSLLT